jgi:hypothetical protein
LQDNDKATDMNKRYFTSVLVAFVVLDWVFTCWQHYHLPLDGDLAAIVLPAPWYTQVLHDPFGWAVLAKHESYSATNRFFAHATIGLYWKMVPRVLQLLVDPISSLYLAAALFATATQAGITLLLASYVSLASGGQRRGFWVVAALLGPLFQTASELYGQLGIIDHAITYTFFYAWPMLLVLVLFWPFFRAACLAQPLRLPLWRMLLLVALMVVVAFNGPLAAAAVAIVLLGVGLRWAWAVVRPGQRVEWLSGQALGLLTVLGLLTLYSLYIGRNNSENVHTHTLVDLYHLLPLGIKQQLTMQMGLPLLLALLLTNSILARRTALATPGRRWVLQLLGWVAGAAAVYLLLLPLGGYRTYRPYLLRYDTFLPITLALLFAYGLSTYYLLLYLRGGQRRVYGLVISLFVGYFFCSDFVWQLPFDNGCERWALDQLARAPGPEVQLWPDCTVMAWGPITTTEQSERNAAMLYYWGVTPSKKLFFQK